MKKTVKSEVSQCAASGSSVPHHWMCTGSTAEDIVYECSPTVQCYKTNFSESPIWIFDKTKMHKTMKTAQPTKRCSVAPISHERIKRVCIFSGLVTLTRWVYLHSAVGVLEISLLFTSPKSKVNYF